MHTIIVVHDPLPSQRSMVFSLDFFGDYSGCALAREVVMPAVQLVTVHADWVCHFGCMFSFGSSP